jgi:ppGpp synthetase/RelA/SpoT-type nucleotidyltranferase
VSSRHAHLLDAYASARPALETHGQQLCSELSRWLAGAGIKIHSISARLKADDSLARKLARPDRDYRDLWSVTDLLGLRVITYFEDAVDEVGRIVEARLPIDLARSNDKRARAEAFGYRSLHYVFGFGRPESLPSHARAEIQIRTLLEHTWAEIEHDLGYKAPGAVPARVRRRLSRLAGLLEVADREFVGIRDELAEYTRALPDRIAAEDNNIALDQLALAALLESPDVAALDRSIASAVELPLGDEVFFPDYLLRMLQAAGLSTAADVRSALAARGAEIASMVRPYFSFAWQTWRLSPARNPGLLRGYALFFLAHAHVLAGASLQIDRVERLTRLYRELDYPHDPSEAQRVAGALVEALRQ